MADNLFIAATEVRSGKSLISLGVMEMLVRKLGKVGFFRPIIRGEPEKGRLDLDIELMSYHFKLNFPPESMYGYKASDAVNLITLGREEEVIEEIIRKYNLLKSECDFVLCEGTDFETSASAFEFDINAEISRNLGAPVLLVANAHERTPEETMHSIELALDSFNDKGCQTIAMIVNRVNPNNKERVIGQLREKPSTKNLLTFDLPEIESLDKSTVGEIAKVLDAEVLFGEEELNRPVGSFTVAAMQLQNFLTRIDKESLIITPGDRADVIVACLAIASSTSVANIAGILLTGGIKPEEAIRNLIQGFPRMIPILSVRENTYPTATIVEKIHSTIDPGDDRKIARALAVFEKFVDTTELAEKVVTTKSTIVTPKMFEFDIVQKAKKFKQRIVLPEGEEERILRAAEILLRREVADIVILGSKEVIERRINQFDLDLTNATIIEPESSEMLDDYIQTYFELRKHKGITIEYAHDMMCDVNFFGTMMIYKGVADAMVSGAVHSTASTVRPSFEIIKTKKGFSIVSSVFLMCLKDHVLVYGDCAINPNPNARELAEIALTSAHTARTFGIEPIVAMLSYSTGESGKGEDVERVREATRIAREIAKESYPGLKIDGPIQYDAAADLSVARTKMPDSEVAGKATVFIFPDLNTGNNTYKAVQRSSGAVAIGPILQGLKRPVNDLSRGCTIADIVNTVAITAMQAQSEKGLI